MEGFYGYNVTINFQPFNGAIVHDYSFQIWPFLTTQPIYKINPCIFSFGLIFCWLNFASTTSPRPEIFKSTNSDDANGSLERQACNHEENDQSESDDDDGLPPLEANTNRMKPMELQTESESDSESDTDS